MQSHTHTVLSYSPAFIYIQHLAIPFQSPLTLWWVSIPPVPSHMIHMARAHYNQHTRFLFPFLRFFSLTTLYGEQSLILECEEPFHPEIYIVSQSSQSYNKII